MAHRLIAPARRRTLQVCLLLLLFAPLARAEVVRVEIRRTDDAGTHERVIGRVYFAIDPTLSGNRGIADIDLAPRNAAGLVEFSSDVLFFRPKDGARTNGAVFLEVVNRGRDQSLAIMSGAEQHDLAPESWSLGDRFLLEQGFAVAFLGWQFDVRPSQGLTFQAPTVQVEGPVRESFVQTARGQRDIPLALSYCATDSAWRDAVVTFRSRMDRPARPLPLGAWQFRADGCAIRIRTTGIGLYEVVYQASGSPVAGLGLAAIRDFAAYLKHGGREATLRENPAALTRVIGYGYSQSARLLREFVRDGFNADEHGRAAFDGLMISSAGAGGGSFNHRFAMPGVAGNSVLSALRPVDIPPFTDDGLLAKADAAHVTPRIFYTFSSTEYWARAGSLTHTTDDGRRDAPLAATSRLYFLAGTPHAAGGLPAGRPAQYEHFLNFADQRWVTRALLLDLDAWVRGDAEPPASEYPSISKRDLVPLPGVHFPVVPSFSFATYLPPVWQMDYGAQFALSHVIAKEPPELGEPYRLLVPQVNEDGNDVGGVRLPELAVPLGTFTGWNIAIPQLNDLRYLAGLVGSFEPFPLTREAREASGDDRMSIAERYKDRQDYLARVTRAAEDLVAQRFMREEDVAAVRQRAEAMWNAVVVQGSRPLAR